MKLTGCEILHADAGWQTFSYLKLTTDEGLTGIAEYSESFGSAGLSGVIERLVQQIIGLDTRAHQRISQHLFTTTRLAPGGVNSQAIAAIENALLDLEGKALGVPVYELLGGPVRDRIEVYWSSCGIHRLDENNARLIERPALRGLDDLVALGQEVRDSGFLGFKTNIFLFDDRPRAYMSGFGPAAGWPELNATPQIIEALRDQLAALREGAGPSLGIRLDLNFNFKPEGYLQVARALDDLGLTWFEIDLYEPAALRRIRDSVGTPIASCESLYGLREFRPYFEHQAVDVAIVDLPWNGVWQSLKIATMAEAYEVNVAPHNFTGNLSALMSAHLSAALPNFRVLELDVDRVPWKDEFLTWVPEVEDGYLALPPGPGWGAELNEDAICAHSAKSSKAFEPG